MLFVAIVSSWRYLPWMIEVRPRTWCVCTVFQTLATHGQVVSTTLTPFVSSILIDRQGKKGNLVSYVCAVLNSHGRTILYVLSCSPSITNTHFISSRVAPNAGNITTSPFLMSLKSLLFSSSLAMKLTFFS